MEGDFQTHTWLLYTIFFGVLGRLFSAEKILQDTYVCMYEYVDLQRGDIKYNHGYYIRGREILLSLLCNILYAFLYTFALIYRLTDSITVLINIFP